MSLPVESGTRATPRDVIRSLEGNTAMILMISVRLAARVHAYLDAYAPTNILIRALRTPSGQRFAFPVSAVMAVGYGLLGAWLTTLIDSGGPGWLNPLALLCAWNTIKFSWCVALGSLAAIRLRVGARGSLRYPQAES